MAKKPSYEELEKRIQELERIEIKHKQAETSLTERESQLRQIIDLVPHFIFAKDETGKFEIVNKATAEVFGTTVEDLTGRRDSEFVATEEELEHFRADDLAVIRSGKTKFIPEEPITDSENNIRYLQTTKVPFKFSATKNPSLLGIAVDITDRKLAEDALRKSEEKFRSIFRTSPDAINLNSVDGVCIDINEGFTKILGYSREDIIGKSSIEVNIWNDPKDKERLFSGLKKSGIVENLEADFIGKDGQNRTGLMSARLLRIGNQDAILSIIRDITEQRKLEVQLQQAQKMESIGTLAGGIAHDFNNILFPIIGLTDMLIETIQDEEIKADLNRILKAGYRATDLVKQILTFSRKHQHEVQSLLLQPILKETIKLSRAAIPSNIKIEQNIDKTCGPIMADAIQIHQVVMNLITNAYQAMEISGGVLSISLYDEYRDEPTSVLLKNKNKKYVCIEVKDNGSGIDKKILDNIFQPYFTTKGKAKGTGLGLAVSHGIIAAFGGEIKVKSEIGAGSCFSVYLPKTDQKMKDEVQPEYKNFRGNREKILIVDDEEPILNMLKVLLIKLNFQVETYLDSRKALDNFKIFPDNYDLIISDLTMPNMTGDEFCLKVKKINPKIPVIILTGYNKNHVLKNKQNFGIDRILTKPVSQDHLLSAISELI